MIQHYLKIALRLIWKNKIQYLLSIIGIAIGLLCFSITSYYIRRYNNQFTAWPNSDRIANVYVKSTANNHPIALLPGKDLQTLISNPPAGIEKISYTGNSYTAANITFIKENKQESYFQCSFQEITPDFLDIFSIRSIEGTKPALKPGDALIARSAAKKIFGNEDPVGKTLCFTHAENDTLPVKYSTICAVIKDQAEGTKIKQDLYFVSAPNINQDRSYWNSITVLLSEGVSSQEINKRLQKHIPPFGENNDCYLMVKTLQEEMREPDNLIATILIPIIGALVLIAAMINFLKFCIQSFYNRTRELSLRKCLGADTKGLFYLLFSEIALLFLFSTLLCFALTEWFIPIYYQYMFSRNILDDIIVIHLPTLVWQQIQYLLLLLTLCILIAIWAVMRLKKNALIEGVKGGKRQKHGIRNFMLGVQLFICFLFISGAVGLAKIHRLIDGTRNNTLTEIECSRIWQVKLWEPQLQGYEKDIVGEIRALAGVEDILVDPNGRNLDYKTQNKETIRGILHCVSANYALFMQLPISGRMPQASNEIAVSRSLIWELEKEGKLDPTSVQLGDDIYQISGIYEHLPFEKKYTKEQIANQYNRFSAICVPEILDYSKIYIKCIPGQEDFIRKEILRVVRTRLPETIPFSIVSLQEACLLYSGGSLIISDLFTLLSIISVLITVLGIYSAISLDTFSRQKEVAIRKINGAGIRTIALLFGKLYIRLLAISSVPALALVYLFLRKLASSESNISTRWLNDPIMWLGVLFLTTGLVFTTIGYRIWQISRVNPAEIIKAE